MGGGSTNSKCGVTFGGMGAHALVPTAALAAAAQRDATSARRGHGSITATGRGGGGGGDGSWAVGWGGEGEGTEEPASPCVAECRAGGRARNQWWCWGCAGCAGGLSVD